mgnify:CR=1 FL=1
MLCRSPITLIIFIKINLTSCHISSDGIIIDFIEINYLTKQITVFAKAKIFKTIKNYE